MVTYITWKVASRDFVAKVYGGLPDETQLEELTRLGEALVKPLTPVPIDRNRVGMHAVNCPFVRHDMSAGGRDPKNRIV
jgi:hypothetical protein